MPNIPDEILELVFLHLNWEDDLIRVANVCRQWANVMASDVFLRKFLSTKTAEKTITQIKHKLVPVLKTREGKQIVSALPLGMALNYRLLDILHEDDQLYSYTEQLRWLQIALHYSLKTPASPFSTPYILKENLLSGKRMPILLAWLNDPLIQEAIKNPKEFEQLMQTIFKMGNSVLGFIQGVMAFYFMKQLFQIFQV